MTTGTNKLQQNTGIANFNYSGFLQLGKRHDGRGIQQPAPKSTNSLFNSLQPTLSSDFRLQRCGKVCCKALVWGPTCVSSASPITTGRYRNEAFKLQVITTVSQIQNIYWGPGECLREHEGGGALVGIGQQDGLTIASRWRSEPWRLSRSCGRRAKHRRAIRT